MALIGSPSVLCISRAVSHRSVVSAWKTIPAHTISLVSHPSGRVVKRVCSDACRETFDDWYCAGTRR